MVLISKKKKFVYFLNYIDNLKYQFKSLRILENFKNHKIKMNR
jgi:hypothetical protein